MTETSDKDEQVRNGETIGDIVPLREYRSRVGRRGHPHELRWHVIERISAGESLRGLSADMDMPAPKTFLQWVKEDEELAQAYENSKRARARALVERAMDEIDAISDRDTAYIADVKARNWLKVAALLDPERYSDKLHSNLHKVAGGNAVQINITIGDDKTVTVEAQENS